MPDVNSRPSPLDNGESRSGMNQHNGNMMECPIRVYARLRPINKLEASRRSRNCVDVHSDDTVITVDSPVDGEYDYEFDKVCFSHKISKCFRSYYFRHVYLYRFTDFALLYSFSTMIDF